MSNANLENSNSNNETINPLSFINNANNIYNLFDNLITENFNRNMLRRGLDNSMNDVLKKDNKIELNNSDCFKLSQIDEDNKVCVICFSNFELEENVVKIKDCEHLYHFDCLNEWVKRKQECPTCRQKIKCNVINKNTNNENQRETDTMTENQIETESTDINDIIREHYYNNINNQANGLFNNNRIQNLFNPYTYNSYNYENFFFSSPNMNFSYNVDPNSSHGINNPQSNSFNFYYNSEIIITNDDNISSDNITEMDDLNNLPTSDEINTDSDMDNIMDDIMDEIIEDVLS